MATARTPAVLQNLLRRHRLVERHAIQVETPGEPQVHDGVGRRRNGADRVHRRFHQRLGAALRLVAEGRAVQLEAVNRPARDLANLDAGRSRIAGRIDLDDRVAAGSLRVAGPVRGRLAQLAVLEGARVAGPVAVVHRLVDVAERQVADGTGQGIHVLLREPAGLAHEVVRAGVKEQDVPAARVEAGDDLADLRGRRGPQVARADEAQAAEVVEGAAPGVGVPRVEDGAVGTERRTKEDEQLLRAEVFNPRLTGGMKRGPVVVALRPR